MLSPEIITGVSMDCSTASWGICVKAIAQKANIVSSEDGLEFLAAHLPKYRDELGRMGMSKEDVDWVTTLVWTGAATSMITSLEDYKRACSLHAEIAKTVVGGDWRSEAAVRMTTLSGEMIRFEQEYEREHGRLPETE